MKGNIYWFVTITLAMVFISGCMFWGGDDVYPTYYDEQPTEEVMGEDLPDVPRYESSTRTNYDKTVFGMVSEYEIFVGITYYTTDDIEKVTQFYFDEMPKYDWNLMDQDASINEGKDYRIKYRNLEFSKSDCREEFCMPMASITIENFEHKGYTLINIGYNNQSTNLI
jgi:hypothetical protein